MSSSLPVLTVRPGLQPLQTLVHCSRRETKQSGSVADSARFRGIVVPSEQLTIPSDACRSGFTAILQQAIDDCAQARLASFLADDWDRREVPSEAFTVPSLLQFWAETRQRSSIDGKLITAWLADATFLPAEVLKTWQVKVPTIAAPLYRRLFSKAQAAAISNRILGACIDLEADSIAAFIVQRCSNILAAEEQDEEAAL